jgi:geranylgeranyl pyrophosphate synthase
MSTNECAAGFPRLDGRRAGPHRGALDRFLPAATAVPAKLHEAMRYTTLGGGKRVRPLLAYAAASCSAQARTRWRAPPARSR